MLDTDFRVGEEAGGSGNISVFSNKFIVKVTISENDITKIVEGNEATVILDAYSDLELNVKVAEIIPISTVDGNIISFEVLIEFEEAEDIVLYYGLSASASIVILNSYHPFPRFTTLEVAPAVIAPLIPFKRSKDAK